MLFVKSKAIGMFQHKCVSFQETFSSVGTTSRRICSSIMTRPIKNKNNNGKWRILKGGASEDLLHQYSSSAKAFTCHNTIYIMHFYFTWHLSVTFPIPSMLYPNNKEGQINGLTANDYKRNRKIKD